MMVVMVMVMVAMEGMRMVAMVTTREHRRSSELEWKLYTYCSSWCSTYST